jgi:hypothetical protein
MQLLMRILTVLVVLVVVALGIGMLMPGTFSVERSTVIAAPPQAIAQQLMTPRTWDAWSAWNTKADSTLRWTYDGPESGAGAAMSWTSKNTGTGTLTITEADTLGGIRYRMEMPGGPTVNGHIALAVEGAGTRVTWHDTGDVGGNPMFKLMTPMMDGMLGKSFEDSFAGLARVLGVAS